MPATLSPLSEAERTATLSSFQVPGMVQPADVIRALNQANVRFVVVGAYGLSAWLQKPRATEDVDIVVMNKHLKIATRALAKVFPHLEVEDHEVVVRFRDPKTKIVHLDIIKQRHLFREVFKHTAKGSLFGEPHLIPSLEMALNLKFAAMMSPNRQDDDKHLDAHDFIRVIRTNPKLDEAILAQLGELVYSGGGQRLRGLVADVKAGRKLVL